MKKYYLCNQAKNSPAWTTLIAAKQDLAAFCFPAITSRLMSKVLMAAVLGTCVMSEVLHAEQTGQTLIMPVQSLTLKTSVRLGAGWENFRVLYPNGAGFVIPTRVVVADKSTSPSNYSGTGGISFWVSGDGQVSSIDTYYDSETGYQDVAPINDTFVFGRNTFAGYYQINVSGELLGPSGACGKSKADGESALVVYKSGINPRRSYTGGWTITVDFEECESCPEGTCEPGNISASLGSLDLMIGIGKSVTGSSKAVIRSQYPNSGLARPSFLNLELSSDAELISGAEAPRQVRLPSGLADIVVINNFSYEIRIYPSASVGSKDANGLYQPTGQPLKTIRVANPDASSTVFNRLFVSEITGGQTRTTEYSYSSATNAWTLVRPDALGSEVISTVETLSSTGSPISRVSTILQKDGDGAVASKTVRSTQRFAWGWETVQEVLDPDGSPLTTSYEFYTDSAQVGSYSRLKKKTDAYGHWERFEYDSAGFETKRVVQYLDNSHSSQDSENRMFTTTYSTSIPHKTVIETLQGAEIARKYEIYEAEGTAISVLKEIVCVAPGAAWNAPGNLQTITKTYNPLAGGPFQGEIKSVQRPDGTLSISSFSQNATQRTVITDDGFPSGSSITSGTRTELRTDLEGNQLFRSTTDIESALTIEQATTSAQDSFGRPTVINYSDGTSELFQYDCCGLESFKDRNGLTTNYTHDALKRPIIESQGGITTVTSYDGAGRVDSRTRIGSDSSQTILETATYDLAGRKASSKDALNNTTTYSESFDGSGRLQRTTTLPDGVSTRVETSHKDGRMLSVSGNAAHPVQYEYGVATGGLQFTKQVKVGDGGSQTEWVKTFTDMAGRLAKMEYADGATEQTYYNSIGQTVRQVDADGVTRLFGYNTRGELEKVAVDLNNNATIDITDQVTQTQRSVASAHGTTVLRTEISEADTGGYVATSTTDQTPNGHRQWETRFGLETSVASIHDGNGGSVQTTIQPDGSKVIETFAYGRLVSRVNQMTSGTVISSITNGYDGQGRLQTQTDARTGTVSTYVHDAADHVTSVDVGGITTGYSFNSLGYETGVTLPGNRTFTRTFLPTGELTAIGGTAEYPVSYTYDAQGRRKTMTTSSGVTTWAYDAARAWLTSKTDADNQAVSYTYTPAGRPESRTGARGITTNYSHDAAGRPTGATYSDATPAVHMAYDQRGRRTSISDGMGTHALGYHASGLLASDAVSGSTLWNGVSTVNSYDSLLRRSGFMAAKGSVTLSAVATSFDGASRAATVVSGNQSAAYSYLANSSLLESILFKNGGATVVTTNKTHDSWNRLTSTSSTSAAAGTTSFAYGYNAAGQRSQATLESNDRWDFGYNSRGEVTAGSKKISAGDDITGYQFGYQFDNIGNRLTATRNGRNSAYTSNAANEYSARTVPGYAWLVGKANAATTVNVNGQAATRQGEAYFAELTAANASAPAYLTTTVTGTLAGQTATRQGKLFVPQTPEAFTHDADGNLTSDGRWTYTWDAENRLVSQETTPVAAAAGAPRERLTFTYDFMSRRIGKKIESWSGTSYGPHHTLLFVYDGWNLVAEILAETGQKIRNYTWGIDMSGAQAAGGVGGLLFIEQQPENKVYSAGFDGNGNVCRLYDMGNAGAMAATYEYGPFGELLTESGPYARINPVRWSTKYQDSESDLVYYGYRYYNPETGRWISRDPIAESGGINLYGFVANNPISKIDPFGLSEITISISRTTYPSQESTDVPLATIGSFTMDVKVDSKCKEKFKGKPVSGVTMEPPPLDYNMHLQSGRSKQYPIPGGTYDAEYGTGPTGENFKLKGVSGFGGVWIHSGSTPLSSEGCILVGSGWQMHEFSAGGTRPNSDVPLPGVDSYPFLLGSGAKMAEMIMLYKEIKEFDEKCCSETKIKINVSGRR